MQSGLLFSMKYSVANKHSDYRWGTREVHAWPGQQPEKGDKEADCLPGAWQRPQAPSSSICMLSVMFDATLTTGQSSNLNPRKRKSPFGKGSP